jgi:hypothetical protein
MLENHRERKIVIPERIRIQAEMRARELKRIAGESVNGLQEVEIKLPTTTREILSM